MSTQSNPVIFVAIGQGADMWQYLSPAIKGYANAVAYIEMPEIPVEEMDDWFKSEVGRIWKEFLNQGQEKNPSQGQYSADIVRVNYLLGTDEPGLKLPAIRQHIEKYLNILYPAGFLTDIYCLLDDDKILENEHGRKSAMKMLQEESGEGLRVYLLSNLTSQNVLIPNSAIAHTISMLTLFKDCVPDVYVTGADASRYNELHFCDNCYSKQGQFLTASSLNVTVPQEGLRALLLTEILAIGRSNNLGIAPLDSSAFAVTNTQPYSIKTMDYLLGMAIPEISLDTMVPRRQWISLLFGKRLEKLIQDMICNVETQEEESLPNLIDPNSNLFDLQRYTAEDGIYQAFLTDAIRDVENEIAIAQSKLDSWLDGTPDLSKGSKETDKRRLSPLLTQDLLPFTIAQEYMSKQAKIKQLGQKIDIYKARRQAIANANQEILNHIATLDAVIAPNLQKVAVLDTAFAPFSPCASDYFRKIFAEYTETDSQGLFELSKTITAAIVKAALPQCIKTVEDYIEEKILPIFNKPIMDTMCELTGKDDVSAALGEWVYNHRQWNIRLKTGYANLYTEINIFMPAKGAANVKRRYEERGLGRMNLFTDEGADSVAVLYHAGAFNIEDLYYESLYAGD